MTTPKLHKTEHGWADADGWIWYYSWSKRRRIRSKRRVSDMAARLALVDEMNAGNISLADAKQQAKEAPE